MARKLTDEFLKWTLDVDGKPAMAALNSMEQSTAKLKNTNKALFNEMAKLEAQGKKNTEEYAALNKQYVTNNATIRQAETRMGELRGQIGLTSLTTQQLRQRMAELKRSLDQTVPNSPEWRQHNQELQQVTARYRQVTAAASGTNSVFGEIKGMLPAMGFAAVIAGLGAMVTRAISVRTEFSKYEAVLTNTLGSQRAANESFAMLKEFAATTPFQLAELTGSYVKLVNQGFNPTVQQLTSLGDLAASQGKSFDQLTEAILDARNGENERLREFGITAKKEGDKIMYTFKGVTTEVANNGAAIQSYILSLGGLQGVAGGMAAISKTIGGALSNASDATDSFFNAIG
jgi:ribosomal protein L29